RRAYFLGLLTVLPLLVWWLGWFPGFMSSDSIDQLGQVERFSFSSHHPVIHTYTMWLLMRIWDSPGFVTLLQVMILAALLGLTARRLVQAGVPSWLAVGTVWVVSALPAVGSTTVAIWKDVPFTLALLWVFTEFLAMGRDPADFWSSRTGPLRLGTGLALVWLFRANGFITVALILVALAIGFRHRWRGLAKTVAVLAVVVVLIQNGLYQLLPVQDATIEPSAVFFPDVAASLVNHPEKFTTEELAYLSSIAPLDLWTDRYTCYDSTPLVFDPQFRQEVVSQAPGDFRALVVRTMLRDPGSVIGHRWCVASFLVVPAQPEGAFFHRPPYEIPPNTLGYARQPISNRAFTATRAVYVWAEEHLWLAWRPALALWAAVLAFAVVAWRVRRLLWAAVPLVAQIVNVAATSPAQEFRYAFGIYLLSLLSLPLAFKGRAT
ncbi:MAG: DUF6020 family protein, partial [Acidimicrobiia bacterium]